MFFYSCIIFRLRNKIIREKLRLPNKSLTFKWSGIWWKLWELFSAYIVCYSHLKTATANIFKSFQSLVFLVTSFNLKTERGSRTAGHQSWALSGVECLKDAIYIRHRLWADPFNLNFYCVSVSKGEAEPCLKRSLVHEPIKGKAYRMTKLIERTYTYSDIHKPWSSALGFRLWESAFKHFYWHLWWTGYKKRLDTLRKKKNWKARMSNRLQKQTSQETKSIKKGGKIHEYGLDPWYKIKPDALKKIINSET